MVKQGFVMSFTIEESEHYDSLVASYQDILDIFEEINEQRL